MCHAAYQSNLAAILVKKIIDLIAICLQMTFEVFQMFPGILTTPASIVNKSGLFAARVVIDPMVTPV